MFGISGTEILVILVVALIVLGPRSLPDLAKALGRAVGEFRRASAELRKTIDADENISAVKKSFETAVAEGMNEAGAKAKPKPDASTRPWPAGPDFPDSAVEPPQPDPAEGKQPDLFAPSAQPDLNPGQSQDKTAAAETPPAEAPENTSEKPPEKPDERSGQPA